MVYRANNLFTVGRSKGGRQRTETGEKRKQQRGDKTEKEDEMCKDAYEEGVKGGRRYNGEERG